jgi:hypothetical protein
VTLKDRFAVGSLLALDSAFDGEDVFAALLPTFEVRTTTFRFFRIELNGVWGAADRLGRNKPSLARLRELGFSSDPECFRLAIGSQWFC